MLFGVALAASAVALSACNGATYGTGKTSEEQLVQDLTGVLSLAPKRGPQIDYSPRPGIVKPPSTEVLPPPQADIASAENPAWPESPEQRLARVRAEATENQDNPLYRPNIVRDVDSSASASAATDVEFSESGMVKPALLQRGARSQDAQRQEYLRRQQIARQGDPTQRRYLSDPPVEYRAPAPTAPADELGEDEWKKERKAKKAGAETGGLRRLIPWLN